MSAKKGQAPGSADKGDSKPSSPHIGRVKNKGTPAALRLRSQKYDENITKRGRTAAAKKNDDGPKISPWVVAVLVFVVCGSAIFGLLQGILFGGSRIKGA